MRRKRLRWGSKCRGSFLMEMRKISGTSLSWVYYSPWITVSPPSFLTFLLVYIIPVPHLPLFSFLLHLSPLLYLLSLFNTLMSLIFLTWTCLHLSTHLVFPPLLYKFILLLKVMLFFLQYINKKEGEPVSHLRDRPAKDSIVWVF